MKNIRKARPTGNRKAARPIRENLLRHLASAKEYLIGLREFESAGFNCGYSILRAKEEIEKLTRLTS
jgi:hypothetical protein